MSTLETATANPDPLAPPQDTDFDWGELYRRLGEGIDQTGDAEIDAKSASQAAEVIGQVFGWIFSTNLNRKGSAEMLLRRAIAFAWVFKPEFLGGMSATRVAELLETSPSRLQELTAEVSRQFPICNRFQSHGRADK